MLDQIKTILTGQYGGTLKMLENAIEACPDDLWLENVGLTPYWANAFHTLFFTDLYINGTLEGFGPPEPFGMTELDPTGALPDRPYTKQELLTYADHCRGKALSSIRALDDAANAKVVEFPWLTMNYLEILFYNARHIQHHVGQLNLILRQRLDYHAPWVGRVD